MTLSKLITAGAIAALSISAVGITATSANALTLESTGLAKDAVGNGANHAFWLPGLAGGSDFIFEGGSGTYNSYTNGYFNLTGTVVSETDSSKKWDVDLWFKDSEFVSDGNYYTGLDKKELASSYYVENGGTIDSTTWEHLDITGFEDGCSGNYCSSITGDGSFAGLNLSLTQRPGNGTYTFQVGEGANGKNTNDGMSGWFNWTLDGTSTALKNYHSNYGEWAAYIFNDGTYYQKDSSGNFVYQGNSTYWHDTSQYGDGYIKLANTTGYGDINIDLESTPIPPPPTPPVSVPEPSLMVGLGLVGFALAKRKKQQATEMVSA